MRMLKTASKKKGSRYRKIRYNQLIYTCQQRAVFLQRTDPGGFISFWSEEAPLPLYSTGRVPLPL